MRLLVPLFPYFARREFSKLPYWLVPSVPRIILKVLQGKAAKHSFALTGMSFSLGYERTGRLLDNAVTKRVERLGKRTHRRYYSDEPKEQEDKQLDFARL
jgi:hypothetical protein